MKVPKRPASILLLALCMALLPACQEKEADSIDAGFIHIPGEGSTRNTPQVQWDTDSVDLGLLAAGESVEIPFELTNTGQAPLVISQVKPSCGCTVAKGWDEGALAPGKSRTITLTFDAGDRIGTVQEQATVSTNAIPSTSVLTFSARILGPESEIRP